jgi:Arc/MetJ-type ribon-helix-helix transcriptional regulator
MIHTLHVFYAVEGTAMRRQFVLDKRTDKLIEELASNGTGNRSMVVRTAVQLLAEMEDRLDKIEANPAFLKMMAESDKAIREGRVTPHSEVVRMSRARSKRRK